MGYPKAMSSLSHHDVYVCHPHTHSSPGHLGFRVYNNPKPMSSFSYHDVYVCHPHTHSIDAQMVESD